MNNYNLFFKTDEFEITKIVKKFQSKRNLVFLIEIKDKKGEVKEYVLKDYKTCVVNKNTETYALKKLRENYLAVPKIYYEAEDFIIIEYIKGNTLLDIIEINEKKQGEGFDTEYNVDILYKVIKWMNDFYGISKEIFNENIILGDINFRNFIITDKVYGIDFENCKRGYAEVDGGRFCAYLITYNPAFSEWKMKLCKLVIEIMKNDFNYNKDLVIKNFQQELVCISRRRRININQKEIDNLVKIIKKQIEIPS